MVCAGEFIVSGEMNVACSLSRCLSRVKSNRSSLLLPNERNSRSCNSELGVVYGVSKDVFL